MQIRLIIQIRLVERQKGVKCDNLVLAEVEYGSFHQRGDVVRSSVPEVTNVVEV